MSSTEINIHYTTAVLSHLPNLADYLACLDKQELATIERLKFADAKQRYAICHGLLRQLLAAELNVTAKSLRFAKAEFGKPSLVDYPDISFNLSHSGDSFLLAISGQCELGADIECYKARTAWEGLVNKCFSVEEIAHWYALDEELRVAAFYQFWVKKEAFVKAVGKGITLGLNQCVLNPNDLNRFLRVPELAGRAGQWQVYPLTLAEGVFAAVVCDQPRVPVVQELRSVHGITSAPS